MKKRRRRYHKGMTAREARIFRRQHLTLLREAAAEKAATYEYERLRPAPPSRAREAYIRALKDEAVEARAIFAAAYRGGPTTDLSGLDMAATFHEAYARHQGHRKTAEKHKLNVVHRQGCGERFQVAIPGTHKLVTAEDGMRSAKIAPVQCPHCGSKVRVRLPEGLAIVRADGEEEGHGGGTGRQGKDANLGMGKDRHPTSSELGEDSEDTDNPWDTGWNGPPLDGTGDEDDEEEPLHRVRGDDAEDEEEDEDEEESEGDEDEEEDEDFAGDTVYDSRRGPTPREEPRSGPYRPGAGVRDSTRAFYRDSERGGRRRASEAIAAFRATLREINRYSGEVH